MGEMRLITGHPVFDHGIYQSTCTCRTALTVLVGQTLPRCLGCDEIVEWVLVQQVRPSQTPLPGVARGSVTPKPKTGAPKPKSMPPPSKSSGVRFKAATAPRERFDSASGDDTE